jgi:C4-dicarboxylate-specific signal transduction histidine kinase
MLRKAEQPRAEIQLSDLVRDSLVLTRGDLMRHHVSVRVTLNDGLPPVIADRVQIQQVMLNLFANACDSMACVPEHERVLSIATQLQTPGYIELAVSDSGVGVEADQLEQIFEPFVTSKTYGLGLGLSICRTIIASHGGRLWAENLARGAAFHLTLPHVVETTSTEAQAPALERASV